MSCWQATKRLVAGPSLTLPLQAPKNHSPGSLSGGVCHPSRTPNRTVVHTVTVDTSLSVLKPDLIHQTERLSAATAAGHCRVAKAHSCSSIS
jgi:hypothetical protein